MNDRSFFFSSRRRHTRCSRDWSSDVCSSDLVKGSERRRTNRLRAAATPNISSRWSSTRVGRSSKRCATPSGGSRRSAKVSSARRSPPCCSATENSSSACAGREGFVPPRCTGRPSKKACASRRSRSTDRDRKSTRLNSSHGYISYAVFCLKKKKTNKQQLEHQYSHLV